MVILHPSLDKSTIVTFVGTAGKRARDEIAVASRETLRPSIARFPTRHLIAFRIASEAKGAVTQCLWAVKTI